MLHLSFFQAAFYFFHYSFYAVFSFFLFHINQQQNTFRQYDPPWCTLCRKLSNDWSNRNAALFDRDDRKEDTRCSYNLQNSSLSKYDLFQRFRIKYWSLMVIYRHFPPVLLIFYKSDILLGYYYVKFVSILCKMYARNELKSWESFLLH